MRSKIKYNILSRISQKDLLKKYDNFLYPYSRSHKNIIITLCHFISSLKIQFFKDSNFNLLQILIVYRFIKKNITSLFSSHIVKIGFYNYFHNNSNYSNYIYSPFKVNSTIVNSLSIYTSLSNCIQMVKTKVKSIFTLLNKNTSLEKYKKNLLIILFLKRNSRFYKEYLRNFVNNTIDKNNILFHNAKTAENSSILNWIRILSKYKKLTKIHAIINNIINKQLKNIAPNVIILIGMKNTSILLKKTGSLYQLSKLYSSTIQNMCKNFTQTLTYYRQNLNNGFESNKSSREINKILRTLACKLLISARLDNFQIKADFSFSIISRGIIEAKIEDLERKKNHL
ncbi:putative SAR DNA-binding protein-1 (nucleomorph) [Bigelowiella natans]|uniref:Putative SAR DNA-binding protein-1 n=1 Tax=Bigelowiella natans TaxID=227086 RepID=Q3LW21_BIGNA|nr:putative SAR DNA-binding protein-1 [Bigelowiella natans]ABA27344.1 putative SAR DNA-binding protein-1 [Bigelowiella natans]